MKIFLSAFCAAVIAASSAYATGAYVGVDGLYAQTRHKVANFSSSPGPQNGDVKEVDKFGYGLNAGVRFDLLNLLASAEAFYDKLDTSSKDFGAANGAAAGGNVAIDNRYGAKLNLGFAILPRVTPFLTYGLANVRYDGNVMDSKTKMSSLYGIGLLVDLPMGWSVKAAYDYQKLNTNYAEAKVRTHLGVARLGVIYNF